MSTDQLFRILVVLTLGTGLTISMYFRRQADRQGGRLDPKGNRFLLFVRLAALIVIGPLLLFLINPDWVAWARYKSPEWLRWLGFAFTVVSLPGLYWLFSSIGKNISPTHATRENHQLITTGPYRFVRHPLYTIGFTLFLGMGLMASMWWLIIGLVVLSFVIAWRTGREEENLLLEFGDSYRSYMKRTGRYLPKVIR